MIDFDTSQYPAGALGWQGLLEAIENASPGDESEWIEFKANLDLRQKVDRPVLAKAIVAFANREVARAAQHFEGRGLIVIGLEPGNLVGAPDIDPAELHDAVQPYLADPAPRWDVQYLTYRGQPVLVVTVNAPQPGDPIHCIAKDGERVRDGDVYVRNVGKSAPAKSADLRRLSTRLLAQAGPGLEVDVTADAGSGIPLFNIPDDWVEQWVAAERARLMAPLAPPPKPDPRLRTSGGLAALGLSDSVFRQASEAARLFESLERVNPLVTRHEEDRTEEDYEGEVDAYLAKCQQRLPGAVDVLQKELSTAVVFTVQNLTDQNFHGLEVHIHVEGDVTAHRWPDRFKGLARYTAGAPRIWGPWSEQKFGLDHEYNIGHLIRAQHATPVQTYTPRPGPDIVNGGSADITFPPVDLRPRATEDLDYGVVLVAGPDLTGDVTCTWSATATNINGRVEGTLTIPVMTNRVSLAAYLHHGSTLIPSKVEDGSTIVYPDDDLD